jgi:ribosomal protein S27E
LFRSTGRSLPFTVILTSVCGVFALAQDQRPGGRDNVVDSVVCPRCGESIPFFQAGTMPTKCPKCGEPITHIVNPDGTKTSTGATVTEKNPYRWVMFGIGGGVLVLAAVVGAIKVATGGGKKKNKKAKPRDEEPDAGD